MKLTEAACTSIRISSAAGFGSSISPMPSPSGPSNDRHSTALIAILRIQEPKSRDRGHRPGICRVELGMWARTLESPQFVGTLDRKRQVNAGIVYDLAVVRPLSVPW